MERMIHVACDDLFFRAKIEATAQAADVDVVFVDSVDEIKGGGLLLVDLNYNAIDPIDAIRRLKSSSATMLVVWPGRRLSSGYRSSCRSKSKGPGGSMVHGDR
jgi:hypothetical protein